LYTDRSGFQNLFEVLTNIDPKHRALNPPYPTPDLNLPLLKFAAFAPKAIPPSPFEDDGNTVKCLFRKITLKKLLNSS